MHKICKLNQLLDPSIAEEMVSHKVFVENLDVILLAGLFRRERKRPMIMTMNPDEAAYLKAAHAALRSRSARSNEASQSFARAATLAGIVEPAFAGPLSRMGKIVYIGARPDGFEKPRYGTPAYAIAVKVGWITLAEEKADRETYSGRRMRSLSTCHRPSWRSIVAQDDAADRHQDRRESRAYVPCLSAELEDNPHLTDGARRCARKLAELTYRKNREGRSLDVTVSYLMTALKRSRRTVQRYLRALEREGYIAVSVIASRFSRMCAGLEIALCGALFAVHHKKRWPPKVSRQTPSEVPANAGASRKSDKEINSFSLRHFKSQATLHSVEEWSFRCAEGVRRCLAGLNAGRLMETSRP